MSSSDTEDNENQSDSGDARVQVTSLLRRHADRRPTETDIDNVMERLAGAGLVKPARQENPSVHGKTTQDDGDTLIGEADAAMLDMAYKRYRQHRVDPDSARVNAVMQRLQDSESVSVESELPQSDSVPKPSLWKALFNLPLQAVSKVSSVIKTTVSGRSRILIPALALAVTTIAVVPLIVQDPDNSVTDPGRDQLAFALPQSLSGNPLAIQSIDPDPGLVAAMAADNDVVDQLVSLGQRVTEMEILVSSENSKISAPLIASRLNSLAKQINDDALATSMSDLSALLEQHESGNTQLRSELDNLRVQLSKSSNPELSNAQLWLVFGEAIEALSIAERLERTADPLALQPSSALADSLKQFNAIKFADSLPDLSDLSAKALEKLATSGESNLDTAQKRADVRALLQQLRLSM